MRPRTASPRSHFRRLLAERDRLRELRITTPKAATAMLADRIRGYTKWKGTDAEVERRAHDRLEPWELRALVAPGLDYFRREWAALGAAQRWNATALRRAARHVKPRPGSEWLCLHTVWGSTYGSQGLGANTYARGRATMMAMDAESHGVESRVDTVKREPPKHRGFGYVHTDDFRVMVKVVDDLDLEVLRLLPGMDLRDFLKACWSKGLNPRVFHPMLPHGLEARLGIDVEPVA